MNKLSHVDDQGKASMVDVGAKVEQLRIAKASGFITLAPSTIQLIQQNNMKKGDVIPVAEIAGIQGAKHTGNLIPLCHPLQLTKIDVKAEIMDGGISVISEVRCVGRTGVEMEALNAVSIALLTIYDMCKAADKGMIISNIKLDEKVKLDVDYK